MVFLAVVLTFALCFLVDWLLQRNLASRPAPAQARPAPGPARPLSPPLYVSGFQVHEEMAFHPGHTWVMVEGPDQVRVGLDDFARKLLGRVERLELPGVGERLVQGRPAWTVHCQDHRARMLSPVSGQVVAINPQLQEDPLAAQREAYGDGWLLQVRVPELRANLNNLLSGSLLRRWMEDTGMRLRLHFNKGLALSFPDGGTAVDELAAAVSREEWEKLVREFLLAEP